MRRGEVWWVGFAGGSGGEVRKTRPAIIVSNDVANVHTNLVQVVPLSSKMEKLFPCDAKVFVGCQASRPRSNSCPQRGSAGDRLQVLDLKAKP